MYSKLLVINHESESKNFATKSKFLVFKFFAAVNEFRTSQTIAFIIAWIFGLIQIVSLMKFNLTDHIDEYEYLQFISIFFNYMIYIKKLNQTVITNFTYVIYAFTILIIVSLCYCMNSIYKSKRVYYLPFSILVYAFIITESFLILPIIEILSKQTTTTAYLVVNIIAILIYMFLGKHFLFKYYKVFLIASFNQISIALKKQFGSMFNNSFSLNLYYLKLWVFILSKVLKANPNFKVLSYLIIAILLIKMTIDTINYYNAVSYNFLILYCVGIAVLYERLISSFIYHYFFMDANGNPL